VLALAGSLEQSSPHVVAKTIVAAAKTRDLKLTRATNVVEQHGIGLTGTVAGKQVEVGQPRGGLPDWCNFESSLLVYIWVDGNLRAIIGLDDPVREESASTIAAMRRLGIKRILIISGDRKSTADAVGAAVGADYVHAECTPEDKLRIVRAESEHGGVIAVGDGINDAPALAAAAVGVAMGAKGSTAASEAADVVIVEDSIKHLAMGIDIAKQARTRALQASGVGMGLAIATMFAAALGFTNATERAVLQEFIDASAILWALVPSRNRIE
jgi:cation transport ATPase